MARHFEDRDISHTQHQAAHQSSCDHIAQLENEASREQAPESPVCSFTLDSFTNIHKMPLPYKLQYSKTYRNLSSFTIAASIVFMHGFLLRRTLPCYAWQRKKH